MSESDKTFDDRCFTANEDDRISSEHRAWMNAQIRETLAQIEAGRIGFRSLEDVMREFGFNAR